MSDNWVVQNLQNALDTWNKYLSEIWQLITQSPEQFKGGSIWGVIVNIHDAVRAIGLALLGAVLCSGRYALLRQLCRGEKAGARPEAVHSVRHCQRRRDLWLELMRPSLISSRASFQQ